MGEISPLRGGFALTSFTQRVLFEQDDNQFAGNYPEFFAPAEHFENCQAKAWPTNCATVHFLL